MAKKILKKKNNLVKDCVAILEKNPDLDTLFSNLDNILDNSLSNKIEFNELFTSLTILGGKEFASVTNFLLNKGDILDAIDFLVKNDIDEWLIQKYKFILSKYGNIIHRELTKINNEYGWKRLKVYNCEVKTTWKLGIEIVLNNGSKVIVRDNPESIVDLIENIVKGLISIKKHTKINDEFLNSLKEQVDILTDGESGNDD